MVKSKCKREENFLSNQFRLSYFVHRSPHSTLVKNCPSCFWKLVKDYHGQNGVNLESSWAHAMKGLGIIKKRRKKNTRATVYIKFKEKEIQVNFRKDTHMSLQIQKKNKNKNRHFVKIRDLSGRPAISQSFFLSCFLFWFFGGFLLAQLLLNRCWM